ncbi:MAG: GtrA family protein [Acidimicrobiales bacterium]
MTTMTAIARLRDLQRAHGVRALKYASVSVVGVAVTQVVLVICYQVLEMTAGWSNFTAVSLASIPAYLLNRAWVWGKSGRHSMHREVLPFWAISLLGLVISTVAVSIVARRWDTQLAVSATNIASFGVIWVAKYLTLDSLLFGSPEDESEAQIEAAAIDRLEATARTSADAE